MSNQLQISNQISNQSRINQSRIRIEYTAERLRVAVEFGDHPDEIMELRRELHALRLAQYEYVRALELQLGLREW